MRICYVAADVAIPHVRGASTHAYEVSRNLVRLGHEVHLVCRRLSASQKGYEELDGVKIHRIYRGIVFSPPISSYLQTGEERKSSLIDLFYRLYLFTLYALYAGFFAANIVKRSNTHVILERETSFGAGAMASLFTGRKMVLEVIGPKISRLSLSRAEKIMVYTELMVPSKLSREKLVFVTAAVDTELFRPNEDQANEIRRKYALGNCLVIGYVGTFQSWHGVQELVYASKIILERHPDVKFLMVGPYYKTTESLTCTLGVRSAYIFTGAVEYREVPKYINASDVLVAPYNPRMSELRRRYGIGSPQKIFEYMACAKPLITTTVRPITAVVQHGINGLLVAPGDIDSLGLALAELIGNVRKAESIGKKARECVEAHYTWTGLARAIERIFYEIAGASHRATVVRAT